MAGRQKPKKHIHDGYCRGVPTDGVWDMTCQGCIELAEIKLCAVQVENPNAPVTLAGKTTLSATFAHTIIEALSEGSDV